MKKFSRVWIWLLITGLSLLALSYHTVLIWMTCFPNADCEAENGAKFYNQTGLQLHGIAYLCVRLRVSQEVARHQFSLLD